MTNWTFCHVRLRGFGPKFPSEWVLSIKTPKELNRARALFDKRMLTDAWKDFIDTTAKSCQRDHFSNATAVAVVKRAESRGESFLEAFGAMFGEMWAQQSGLLAEGMTVYMRSCGSYTFDDGTRYDILETRQSDQLIFPNNKEIRFLQWPGGEHWYVKVGNADVRVDGVMKWDTKAEAESAVKRFLAGG